MRHAWKLALSALVAASMAGCANENNNEGGGGGENKELNRDARTYENSNPVSREQENRDGALPLKAEPNTGTAVNGQTGDERIQGAESQVIARGGVPTQRYDVNSASVEQLTQVPGISNNMAEAIVNNRPYRNKQDLLRRVPNLDKRFLSSFDQYLTVGAPKEKGAGVPMENGQ